MLNLSQSVVHLEQAVNWKTDEAIDEYSEETPLRTLEKYLRHLNFTERIFFLAVFIFVCVFGVIGNVLTLVVTFTKKQRLLFKVCLFSLSLSDLLYILATGTSYISKLSRDTSLLWTLGSFGCTLIPFIQTSCILISSLSLVSIAIDRYLAVLNVSKSPILQSKRFCISALLLVWTLSCGVSCPTLFSYEIMTVEVHIAHCESDEDFYTAYLCQTNMDELATFYIIAFTFIFLPIFVAFIWFNTVIATEIWKRRHAPGVQSQPKTKKADEDSSTLEIKATDETNTSSNVRHNPSKSSSGESKISATSTKQPVFTIQPPSQTNIDTRRSEHQRQRRQMRMFKVILVLMFTFISCRLPNWIFLLYKLSNKVSGRLNWLLLYSFAVMGLLNCMLNPLLYTFLGETIRITSRIGSACYKFCKLCRRSEKTTSHYANNQTMFARNERPRKSDGGIYLGS